MTKGNYNLDGGCIAFVPQKQECHPDWLIVVSPSVSSVPRNFIPGRDGIEVQSRDPGIFRDGISLIFSSRDFLEIVRDFSGLTFLMELVISFHR